MEAPRRQCGDVEATLAAFQGRIEVRLSVRDTLGECSRAMGNQN